MFRFRRSWIIESLRRFSVGFSFGISYYMAFLNHPCVRPSVRPSVCPSWLPCPWERESTHWRKFFCSIGQSLIGWKRKTPISLGKGRRKWDDKIFLNLTPQFLDSRQSVLPDHRHPYDGDVIKTLIKRSSVSPFCYVVVKELRLPPVNNFKFHTLWRHQNLTKMLSFECCDVIDGFGEIILSFKLCQTSENVDLFSDSKRFRFRAF